MGKGKWRNDGSGKKPRRGMAKTFRRDMEQEVMKENHTRFLQSMEDGTPFTCKPLLGNFGYLAVGEKARKLLSGDNELLPDMDLYVVKLLSFLKMKDNIKMVFLASTILSTEDFQSG